MGTSQSDSGAPRRPVVLPLIASLWLFGAGLAVASPRPLADPAEREAQRLDLQLKRGQLAIQRQEAALQDRELAKPANASTWNWGSPLVVAVFAAAVAALGNALVALLNGRSQWALERSKSESDRILEVVKTGDPEKAATNLRFLVDAGLVSEPKRVEQIHTYLANRQAGGGIALPTPGRFAFAKDPAASEDVQKDLAQSLNAFQAHLHAIGFKHTPSLEVKIHDEAELNAFFSPQQRAIEVHPLLTSTSEIVLVEYAGAVLWGERAPDIFEDNPSGGRDAADRFLGLFFGVREYVVASYRGDPQIGAVMARLLDQAKPYLRNLENLRDYGAVVSDEWVEPHLIGEVWGGALWEIRARVGKAKADVIVAQAWESLSLDLAYEMWPVAFIQSLETEAQRVLTEAQTTALSNVFRRRNFTMDLPKPPRPKRQAAKAGPRPSARRKPARG
jgi:hypothetical protein